MGTVGALERRYRENIFILIAVGRPVIKQPSASKSATKKEETSSESDSGECLGFKQTFWIFNMTCSEMFDLL